jgi:hypothetical protein
MTASARSKYSSAFAVCGGGRLERNLTGDAIDLDLEPFFLIGLQRGHRFGNAASSIVEIPERRMRAREALLPDGQSEPNA